MAGANSGSSVLGIAFDGGVLIAADTLISYGSMARFRNCERIQVVNDHSVIAVTGDFADHQHLSKLITQKQIEEKQWGDGLQLYPAALHSWITRVAYNKRSKFQPLWCQWIVGGLQPNETTGQLEPFLGFVDKLGTAFKSNIIATGFGQLMALPLFRELVENQDHLPTEQEARDLITKCMEVLYYRDARSWPKYQLAVVKAGGAKIEGPIEFQGNWQIATKVYGQ